MSLQFILGNSGCGKSYYLYRHLVDEAQLHPEKVYMLLVPEQFTVQTERELVRLAPDSVIMNIEVLSFQRLAYRVFEELGISTLDFLLNFVLGSPNLLNIGLVRICYRIWEG